MKMNRLKFKNILIIFSIYFLLDLSLTNLVLKKTELKKTKTKKPETKKPTVGTKRPFWDGRSRASTPGYRENYNSIFKQKRNFRRSSK